jgi:hypothetical protein
MSEVLWENLRAEVVFGLISDELGKSESFRLILEAIREAAPLAYEDKGAMSDVEFLGAFIVVNPELFAALKSKIDEIFMNSRQFAPVRNPDLGALIRKRPTLLSFRRSFIR